MLGGIFASVVKILNNLTIVDTVVDRIEVDTTSIESKVDTIDTVVDTIDTVVDRIEADTTSIESKVDALFDIRDYSVFYTNIKGTSVSITNSNWNTILEITNKAGYVNEFFTYISEDNPNAGGTYYTYLKLTIDGTVKYYKGLSVTGLNTTTGYYGISSTDLISKIYTVAYPTATSISVDYPNSDAGVTTTHQMSILPNNVFFNTSFKAEIQFSNFINHTVSYKAYYQIATTT